MLIDEEMQIEAAAAYPWVSRGGVKLEAALDAFGFDPEGRICLDVGASTGGFSDVLLARGAAQIYAVDVGRGQLSPKLCEDPRVIAMEATDARALTPAHFSAPPSFITCDVSFISLRLVLPNVLALAAPGALLVALIKPQFEVGPAFVVKGIVKDAAKRQGACATIEALLRKADWEVKGLIPSPIDGADGNREYLDRRHELGRHELGRHELSAMNNAISMQEKLQIERLGQRGEGIAHADGKVDLCALCARRRNDCRRCRGRARRARRNSRTLARPHPCHLPVLWDLRRLRRARRLRRQPMPNGSAASSSIL